MVNEYERLVDIDHPFMKSVVDHRTEEDYSESPLMSAEQQALLEDFSTFLLNEQPQSSSTIPQCEGVDLYSLFLEMTELKNEVKLESRQIKKALDDYKELIGLLKSNNTLLSQQLSLQNDLQVRTKEQQRKEYALELIGFCDYLSLSLDNMRCSCKIGWLSKWSKSAKFISSVIEGQSLLLSRFQTLLSGLDVRPMLVIDQAFNPAIMCVGETCTKRDRQNGIVISELQTGYYMGQSILRLANVVVNKL